MRVPLESLALVMSMQPPSIWRVPLAATVQFCAATLPSHVHICTLLPGVALALLLSTQSALSSPATIGPVAPALGAGARLLARARPALPMCCGGAGLPGSPGRRLWPLGGPLLTLWCGSFL